MWTRVKFCLYVPTRDGDRKDTLSDLWGTTKELYFQYRINRLACTLSTSMSNSISYKIYWQINFWNESTNVRCEDNYVDLMVKNVDRETLENFFVSGIQVGCIKTKRGDVGRTNTVWSLAVYFGSDDVCNEMCIEEMRNIRCRETFIIWHIWKNIIFRVVFIGTIVPVLDPLMHPIFFGLESAIGPKIRIIPKQNKES